MIGLIKNLRFFIIATLSFTGCLPYITHQRNEVLVKNLDVASTLVIAQKELAKGGTGSILTLWALRDQHITPKEAEQVNSLYFKYIDSQKSSFSQWHLTWAISDMYRLGNEGVKKALAPAYKDAAVRATKIHKVADKLVNGNEIYMGDAHGGGRAYARKHLVAPGNYAYLQSLDDYKYLQGKRKWPDTSWGPGPPGTRNFVPEGYVKQPSFVSGGGILNKNEHAFILSANADVLPPAILAGYRYGMLNWWEVGVDVGGNYGVFEALFQTKIENLKTQKTERFYWGTTYKTGFKHHKADLGKNLVFDDQSWVFIFENTFAFRFGSERRMSAFAVTQFYIDLDLHTPRRQTDYYISPILLGWENMVGKYGNFFIQAGMAYSINGMELSNEVVYNKSWFPMIQMGFGLRSDDITAIYYTKETRQMADTFR